MNNADLLESIIANVPHDIFWKDTEGRFLGCNRSFAKAAGFNDPKEMIGKTDHDMPWKDQADKYRADDKNVIINDEAKLGIEDVQTQADGKMIVALVSKVPLKDKNNTIIGVLGIYSDITEIKETEQELIDSKKQLEIINRDLIHATKKAKLASEAKTEFLENMRHDIRTPLSGISGFAGLIKKEAPNDKVREYTDNLIASCHALQDFLNNILEAIRVLNGEEPHIKKKFIIEEYINNVIDLNRAAAAEKLIKLTLKINKNLPRIVIGDHKRLHRILLELVTNAIKFTDQGFVRLKVDILEQKQKSIIIRFTIEDSGPGLSKEQQEEIFIQFKRLTPSYRGNHKGLGMGLTMVKQFSDELDAEIFIDSSAEKGTKFIIDIPFALPLTQDQELVEHLTVTHKTVPKTLVNKAVTTATNTSSGPKVLVVEDNILAANVAQSILKDLNCQVEVAENGLLALGMCKTQQYDIIFMDVGLPDIDGCEVTQNIRRDEANCEFRTPIIALTAHIDKENKQRCIEFGMDAVLSKPLAQEKAIDVLNYFLPSFFGEPVNEEMLPEKDVIQLPEKIIDLEKATKVVGKPELAKEMLDMFIESLPDNTSNLEKAHQQNNWELIQQQTHKLLGGTYYCGTPRLTKVCEKLESSLKENSLEFAERLYQQLLFEIKQVQDQYQNVQVANG